MECQPARQMVCALQGVKSTASCINHQCCTDTQIHKCTPESINTLSHRRTQSQCLSPLLGVDVISAPLAKGNHCCIYVCEHNYYYRGCFKQEKMGVMNETHTFHNSSGFPPLTPPLKNNETLSLERRNPYSTGCCCRCIFPSHVFPPSFFSPALTFSLFVVLFIWAHPAHAGQPQNGRFPWGR